MATYKVLQDIEAEDKLLGPLTLKQFIFAIITIAIGFIMFRIATTPALSVVRWPFVVVLFFPMLVFGFLAAPISRDQPNDVWLLARLRFLLKPHVRIWNQDGLRELVTITAPKHAEMVRTNGLNQTEVKSRLTALANTLDSRGWAIKNVDVNLFTQPDYLESSSGSDRLVAPSALPIAQQTIDVHASDDIMDAVSNPIAQHLDKMVHDSELAHHQAVMEKVKNPETKKPSASADYWFMNQTSNDPVTAPVGYTTFQHNPVVTPGSTDNATAVPTADEQALIAKIEAEKKKGPQYNSNTKVIQPLNHDQTQPATLSNQPDPVSNAASPAIDPASTSSQQAQPSGASTPHPAILNLANNDDLNVATIARQAKRISESDDEVVISLR